MDFFNFGPEQKLDHHSYVEFHSDSDGNGFNLSKNPTKPPKCPIGAPKNDIFNFGLEQKLHQHFSV